MIQQLYRRNLITWSDIHDHLPLLHDEAKGNVMEIGVRGGFSTSALLAGVEEHGGHVYSVDINPCRLFEHPQWTFVHADSIKEVDKVKAVIPTELSLLFVDGDHTYEGCLSDLEKYGHRSPKILIHDCDCPLTFPGVRKACERYAEKQGRKFEVIPGSYGMGVIQ